MKCYTAENRLHLVGKAWEVRHYLKRLRDKSPGGVGSEPTLRSALAHTAFSPTASSKIR